MASAEQVLAPEFAALTQQLMPGVYAELLRLSGELHTCLGRRLVTLSVVARVTAGDQVLPGRLSAARLRRHMVEREFGRRQ